MRNITYVSVLSSMLAGCIAGPNLKNPEVRAQLEGTYKGVLDGNKVSYKVGKDRCAALVDFETGITLIVDHDCDNTADLMNFRDRKYLLESGKAKDVDEVLEYIQRKLVKPEYKIK